MSVLYLRTQKSIKLLDQQKLSVLQYLRGARVPASRKQVCKLAQYAQSALILFNP